MIRIKIYTHCIECIHVFEHMIISEGKNECDTVYYICKKYFSTDSVENRNQNKRATDPSPGNWVEFKR